MRFNYLIGETHGTTTYPEGGGLGHLQHAAATYHPAASRSPLQRSLSLSLKGIECPYLKKKACQLEEAYVGLYLYSPKT